MAWLSFVFLLTAGVLLLYGLILSPARESVAASVAVASGALNGLFTVFTTIVVSYIGASLAERVLKKGDEDVRS